MKADARSMFRRARTFAVYYGRDRLRELALFDVCIIEPAAHTREEVERLLRAGTLPVAYLSCMEWGEHLAHYGRPQARDYLRVRGGRVFKPEFSTWVMDPRSADWRRSVVRAASRMIQDLGYQGLFLDTLDDAEAPSLSPQTRDEVLSAAVHLVGEVRSAFPGVVLIQNRGLNWILRRTAPFIDGVCWEGFGCGTPGASDAAWTAARLREIEELRARYDLRVMLLGPSQSGAQAVWAALLGRHAGFMCYAAMGSYESAVNVAFVGPPWKVARAADRGK